jgi:hypothetical protein
MRIPRAGPTYAPVTPTSPASPFPASHRSALAWCLLPRACDFPLRIILTHRKYMAYKAAATASSEPIGFTEGVPSSRGWSIPPRVHRRCSPVIAGRIFDEEADKAIHISLRYRSERSDDCIETALECLLRMRLTLSSRRSMFYIPLGQTQRESFPILHESELIHRIS